MTTPEGEATKALIEGAAGLLPQVYEDGLQRSVQEIGSTLHGVVRVALKPVNIAIWGIEQSVEWVTKAVSDRFAQRSVPEERVISPAPQLLEGVIRGLQAAGPEGESGLREWYAALLATAMDSKTADDAHPAFAEVIRQITPDEAKILKLIHQQHGFVIVQIGYDEITPSSGESAIRSERTQTTLCRQANCARPKAVMTYVENLKRLGFVVEHEDTITPSLLEAGWKAVTTAEHLSLPPKEYQHREHEAFVARQLPSYDDPAVQEFVQEMKNGERVRGELTLVQDRFLYVSSLSLTDFGGQLLKACLD